MAVSRQVDLLEPINLAEHLDKVELYLGQVCAIAGISKMQLDYWTNKAQIPTKGKKQRIYDIEALETVMLIKQAKDKGLNLGAAIEAAQRFRELEHAALDGRLPQRPRRLLRRDGVHPDPGAELDAGEDAQPRHQLEVRPGGATRSTARAPPRRAAAHEVAEQEQCTVGRRRVAAAGSPTRRAPAPPRGRARPRRRARDHEVVARPRAAPRRRSPPPRRAARRRARRAASASAPGSRRPRGPR